MQLKNTLFALNNILSAAEGSAEFGSLDAESRAILKFIGYNTSRGEEVCVTDITQNPALGGSPVTLMKRLRSLKDGGWLEMHSSSIHHRRIRLELSIRAKQDLNRVSAALEKSLTFVKKTP
jgi:hypothetical protein